MTYNEWLQSRLTAHGFPVGPIDGSIGPNTLKAIAAFQAAKGLKLTGVSDKATVDALRVPASTITPAVAAALPDRNAVAKPPAVVAPAPRWPRQSGVPAFYGEVGQNQTQIEIPFDMFLAWDKGVRIRKMTLHKLVAESALRVLTAVEGVYSADERKTLGIDLFGGSLNVRHMRGGTNYSMHSWGIAIDFDPERNQLSWGKDKARLAQADAVPFWQAWEAEGWLSLGRARNFDWMHIQAANL